MANRNEQYGVRLIERRGDTYVPSPVDSEFCDSLAEPSPVRQAIRTKKLAQWLKAAAFETVNTETGKLVRMLLYKQPE